MAGARAHADPSEKSIVEPAGKDEDRCRMMPGDTPMKKAVAVLAMLVLLLGTVVPSDAWGRHGGGHGRFHGGCCWWWPGAIIGGLVLGAAVAATASPYYYYDPPPVVYQPAPVYAAPAAPPPPVQREVVYPHGRYVLYGDGVSRAWQWVWVPAALPPPPPPPAAPR